jgi:hypothetical protein
MVLGGLPPEEMSQRIQLPLEVLAAWERCFFDARDWGVPFAEMHVVRPAQQRGANEFAARVHLAMAGGPHGARAVLDLDKPPINEGERIIKRELALGIKLDAALNWPIRSERGSAEFVKNYLQFQIERGRIELAKARLAARCDRERDKALRRQARAEQAELKAQQAAARKRDAEDRRRQEAARLAAQQAERELVYHARRAEEMARAARAHVLPLARLRWAGEATPQEKTRPKHPRRRPAGAQRPPARVRGRKIPPEIGRGHRGAAGRRSARCVEHQATAREFQKVE